MIDKDTILSLGYFEVEENIYVTDFGIFKKVEKQVILYITMEPSCEHIEILGQIRTGTGRGLSINTDFSWPIETVEDIKEVEEVMRELSVIIERR